MPVLKDPLESTIQGKARDYAVKKGWRPFKRTMFAGYGKSGDPDFEFNGRGEKTGRGYTFFMELKKRGKKSTEIQKKRQEELRELGFNVYSDVDSVEKAKDIIDAETKIRSLM